MNAEPAMLTGPHAPDQGSHAEPSYPAAKLLEEQSKIIELMADDASFEEVLRQISLLVEHVASPTLCSILLLQPDGKHLLSAAGPSLPPHYNAAINGVAIGPSVGSCGTAAWRKEPVIVTDIATDPLWEGPREFALSCGLRACWSLPIINQDRTVLGTIAMYYREPRAPTGRDFALLTPAAALVRLALSQHRKEEAERAAQACQREAERKLNQAQKLDALGTLAGGIAHDLNNSLVPVLAMAKLLRKSLPAGSAEHEQNEMIVQGATHAKELVQQVLAFSRKEEPELKHLDLCEVARGVLAMLRHSVLPPTKLIEEISPVPQIKASAMGLHQIIVNLVTNAVQAIGDDTGEITVAVRPSADGGHVELLIADTGPGMDEATLGRVFEPFFTTKAVGQGTGLGLSVVHGIVTSFGGSVDVESAAGRGTCFTIRFPAMDGVGANAL